MIKKTFVWQPHSWFVSTLSQYLGQGYELFSNATYYTQQHEPEPLDYYEFDLKVVILDYFQLGTPLMCSMISPQQPEYLSLDLSWADLVIIQFVDPLFNYHRKVFDQAAVAVNSQKLVFFVDGYDANLNDDMLPTETFYTKTMTWFSQVAICNDPISIDHVHSKPYLFECVWGNSIIPAQARTNRVYSYYMLQETGLIDQSLVSISGDGTGNYSWFEQPELNELYAKYGKVSTYRSPALDSFESDKIKKIIGRDVGELNVDYQYVPVNKDGFSFITTFCNVIPDEIYRNTWYSIVCETAYSGKIQLTEKTAKCLWAGRVFILVSSCKNLEYLRSFGFQTFHGDLIDESYDNEPNDAKRFDMAWEQIRRLSNMDPQMVYTHFNEVLKHNQKIMATFPQTQILRFADFLQKAVPRLANVSESPPTTDYFVWDPHTWWEFNHGLITGTEFFPKAEIYRGAEPPNANHLDFATDRRKKVAVLFYEQIFKEGQEANAPPQIRDISLQWADLIVVYSNEFMPTWWPMVYSNICQQVHNDRIVCLFGGQVTYTEPPADRIYTNMRSFFSMVATANHYQEINQINTPFRKYMFDALIGTVKTARMFLMYRLLDHDMDHHMLINLQPNPHGYSWDYIQQIDPVGFAKYGKLENYSSPALLDLEEPVIKQFKHDTQYGSSRDRYSVNLVSRPGYNLPNNNVPSSVIVPWSVYQTSWYSIVCETGDTGSSTDFLTEKTAKCLFAKRIFIMMNGAGLLRSLKKLGFRTFHGDIIDESYDNEPNDAKRFDMAWQQIHRLYHTENPIAVYAHFQDVLDHNHQLMMSWTAQQLSDARQFIHTSFALEQTKM
jgi:hypothetical protein